MKSFLLLSLILLISCGKPKRNVDLSDKYYSVLDSYAVPCKECLVVQVTKRVISLQFNPVFTEVNKCNGQATYQVPLNHDSYEMPTEPNQEVEFILSSLSALPVNNPPECLPEDRETMRVKKLDNHPSGGDYQIQFVNTGTGFIIKSYN